MAMTRAEDKLLLTAGIEDVEDKLVSWEHDEQGYMSLSKANSLLDFAMPALIKEKNEGRLIISVQCTKELVNSKIDEVAEKEVLESDITKLISSLPETEGYEALNEMISREKDYIYPFKEAVELKSKMTVSEIKRLHLEEEEIGEAVYNLPHKEAPEFKPYIPEFMSKEPEETKGAARGTLYHNILSRIDFGNISEKDAFKNYILELNIDKKITNEELSSIDLRHFAKFFESNLYKRMRQAFLNGKLYREAPFVIGIDREVNTEKETVLVQGIIDAWFTEDEDVILMDYKTDRVYGKQGEEELVRRYKLQLDNYAEALRRITGKIPKEKLIYSFALGKEILIED